jgi:inorganic pyrophosphatase
MTDQNNIFHTIPAGEDLPKEVNIIIEISEGSRVKYEFEKKYGGVVFVDRFLHTPIPYPFSYGLIPQTWNEYDNDPLDAIVIANEPIIPGCVAPCRVIGMLSVDDSGERDDKILCVPTGDPYFAHIHEFADLPKKKREDIEYFMSHYKDLEKEKR